MRVWKVILFALLLAALAPVLLAQDAEVEQLIREFKGEAPLRALTPPQLEAAYAKVLDSLLPKMGSEDENEQKMPQQTLQDICWRAARPGAETERLAVCKAIAARLGANMPKPARLWLIKQLEHIGRAESVASLAPILADPDPPLRDRALRALAVNPSPDAANAIRGERERAEKTDWRVALINALALRNDPADVPALTKLGASDGDAVRSAALAALARMGDKAAADVIAAGMTKGSKQAQAIAADAYLLLADSLCQKGDKTTALTMYRKLLASQGHLKCAAVLGLANAGGLQELPALTTALGDKDERIRGAAIAGLVAIQDRNAVSALTDKLKAASPELKISLLRVLAQRGDKAAVPAVLDAAKDAAEDVRIAAYESMGKLADGRAGDVLVAALVKTEGKQRDAAAAALNFIPGEGIVDAIIGGLAKTDEKGRVELVKTLATRKSPKVVPALLKTAEDADVNVRAESFKALANLADEKALPSLLSLLAKTTDGKDQKEAEKAVATVARRVGKAESVLTAFASASMPARCSLLRVMSKVGGKDFLGRTCSLLRDENAEVQ
ncbi:MAG: hypothetical protein FJ272_13675, partial [Planctomycetes bacterium]|nr:hypothetical protein [Planctomycetota bacterium]